MNEHFTADTDTELFLKLIPRGFLWQTGFLPFPRTGGFDENSKNDERTFGP